MKENTEISFDEVYAKYFTQIQNYCCSKNTDFQTAEEITQDAFLLLYVKWEALRSHAEPVLASWLYRTAKNLLFGSYRLCKKRLDTVPLEESFQIAAEEGVDSLSYEQYMSVLKKELRPKEMILLLLVTEEGMSLPAIAVLLDTNVNTIKARWRRLKKKAAKIITKIEDGR